MYIVLKIALIEVQGIQLCIKSFVLIISYLYTCYGLQQLLTQRKCVAKLQNFAGKVASGGGVKHIHALL